MLALGRASGHKKNPASTLIMMVHNPVQDNCVNKSGTSCEGLAHGRSDVISSGHSQIVTQRPDDKLKFQVASLNIGTMRGRSGEVVETMSQWTCAVYRKEHLPD